MILFEDGNHQGMLKLLYQNLPQNQKYEKQYLDFERMLSSYQKRKVLNLLGVVKLLRNCPNQHVYLLIQELLHELSDQSKLVN
eukprot:evm.model.NODE_6961_length_112068_cov_42.665756.9